MNFHIPAMLSTLFMIGLGLLTLVHCHHGGSKPDAVQNGHTLMLPSESVQKDPSDPNTQPSIDSDHAAQPNAMYPVRVPRTIVFERDLKPILEILCVQCHNATDAHLYAGLNLETRQSAMNTGVNRPVIIPGAPDKSRIVQVLKLDVQHPTNMPPSPDKIRGIRLQILRKWILQGADWPDNVSMVKPEDPMDAPLP
ncbi:MAG: hypothetical protein KJO21_09840 [Verrucomicrobiae bacterium]|nr:hypothetical protein [Verrucomicrobiae bacterium]